VRVLEVGILGRQHHVAQHRKLGVIRHGAVGDRDQGPFEIEEAAMVDGASQMDLLRYIVFPLLMPGIVAASLLSAMLAWNEFLFALTLTRSAAKTASVGISEFTNMYGTQWGSLTAAATVTVAPILVATMILRRRLVEGLTFGAVK